MPLKCVSIPWIHVVVVLLVVGVAISLPIVSGAKDETSSSPLSATLLPYARFLVQRMMRPVRVNDKLFAALTETEKAMDGDDWMWIDDNAKSLELLALPGVYEKQSVAVDRLFAFALEMMKDDMIIRRVASDPQDHNIGRFRFERHDAPNFRFHNGLMTFHSGGGNTITQTFRFHDGRDANAAKHYLGRIHVEFENGRQLDMDPTVNDTRIRLDPDSQGGKVNVIHSGPLEFHGEIFATFSHHFSVNADHVVTEQTFRFTPVRGAWIKEVKVSFDVDCALPGKGEVQPWEDLVHLDHLCWMDKGSGKAVCKTDRRMGSTSGTIPFDSGAPLWVGAVRGGNAGFSYGLYWFSRNRSSFTHMSYEGRRYQWMKRDDALAFFTVRSHYTCRGGVTADKPCVIQEGKLLVGGGLHDQIGRCDKLVSSIAKGETKGMIDYSISYDIGAELNSLSSLLLFHAAKKYTQELGMDVDLVRTTIDRHIRVYFSVFAAKTNGVLTNIFVRGLSFLILALNNMYTATRDSYYAERLDDALGMLLEMETQRGNPGQIFRCFGTEPSGSAVDCHSSAILAMARVLATFPFERAPSNAKHLNAHHLAEMLFYHGPKLFHPKEQGKQQPQWGLQGNHGATFEWSFQCAITLRSFHAVKLAAARHAHETTMQAITFNINGLLHDCSEYLEAATKVYNKGSDGEDYYMKEIKTSRFSFETNTETQPWATLGLHGEGVERLISKTIAELWEKPSDFFEEPLTHITDAPAVLVDHDADDITGKGILKRRNVARPFASGAMVLAGLLFLLLFLLAGCTGMRRSYASRRSVPV